MNTSFVFVVTAIFCSSVSSAFVVSTSNNAVDLSVGARARATSVSLGMIGGRGWDNQDYLSSLSGDEEDREKSEKDYKDFSDRRAAFNARQGEIMKTPQGQAFMKQRQEQQFRNLKEEEQQSLFSEDGLPFEGFTEGSGGGTRMSQMMAQAKRMQGRRGGRNMMMGGSQQQLLGPLEDEEEEEN